MATLSQQQARARPGNRVWRLRLGQAAKLVGVVVVLSFAYGVGTSSYFWIREVQVIAPEPQLAQQALARIQVPAEASALFYPVRQIVSGLETYPPIRRAVVKRDLPGRLVVHIWPRTPVAAVKYGPTFGLVDEKGVCVSCVSRPPSDLPHIYGLIDDPLAPGEQLQDADQHLLTQCLAGVADNQIKHGLVIDFSEQYAIQLCTANGVRGKVGTTDNLKRKVMMFAGILKELEGQGKQPAYIDVRVMDRPVWKPRQET